MIKIECFLWMISILLCVCLFFGCNHSTNLEDISEEVISKGRGVTIDIEPGQKK